MENTIKKLKKIAGKCRNTHILQVGNFATLSFFMIFKILNSVMY